MSPCVHPSAYSPCHSSCGGLLRWCHRPRYCVPPSVNIRGTADHRSRCRFAEHVRPALQVSLTLRRPSFSPLTLTSAELAPPEVRGSLVALQQLAITFGIMISFWIDYGTNYIGGVGETQSEAAWRLPIALQLVPALILGFGILFMPFSPRWLVNNGREEEALAVLSRARGLPPNSDLVQIEFLYVPSSHSVRCIIDKVFAEKSRPNTCSRRRRPR